MILRGIIRKFNTSVSLIRATRMPFYAVRAGHKPGIYTSWPECEEQIKGFKAAKYKKFDTEKEAQDFLEGPNANIKAAKSEGASADSAAGDTEGGVTVFIHGCCHTHKTDQVSGIGVYFGADDKDNFSARIGGSGKQSINRSEILAAARAIEKAKEKGIKHLVIKSENQFMINCASQWMEGWKKKGWKKSNGEEVTNREELEELDAASKDIKITYVHLDSKSRDENSDAAKQLAKAGTKMAPEEGSAKKRSHSTDSEGDSADEPTTKKKAAPTAEDLKGGVKVYTDGCCHSNGKDGAKAGIGVYWGPDDPKNLSERLSGKQTNNRAEIIAAKRAIEQAKEQKIKHLILHTDSQFLINCATQWMEKWKKNGWKKSDKGDVTNREELEELDQVSQGIKVTYIHVDAHTGIPENEAADKLANAGARLSLD